MVNFQIKRTQLSPPPPPPTSRLWELILSINNKQGWETTNMAEKLSVYVTVKYRYLANSWEVHEHKIKDFLWVTYAVLPAGLSKKKQKQKKHKKKTHPFWEKNTISAKKALFDIMIDLKRVFCLHFYIKYPFSICLKILTTYSKYFLWHYKHL